MDPKDKLSKYFRYYECVQSDTASRHGIINIPTEDELEAIIYHSRNVLDPIREKFGSFSPTSWFRCEELEKMLCYSSYKTWCVKRNIHVCKASWMLYLDRKSHPKGESTDIKIPGVSNIDLYNWIKNESGIIYDQLILEFVPHDNPFDGWVHVSSINETTQRKNRKQAFDIN